jgi:hypothetical protein
VNRWLLVVIGLAVGAAALYALLPNDNPPLDDIDAASRAKLERVLRESGSGSGG